MKYMGSKLRIKKEIVPMLQQLIDTHQITTYVEPFCGGCNVIDAIVCDQRLAGDNHPYLIELLKHVSQGGELPEAVEKEFYSQVRANPEDSRWEPWLVGAVGFLASYNGRYFDGGYAKTVTTKTGVIRNYYEEAKRNLLKQAPLLADIQFYHRDYREWSELNGALIYCDIPYQGTKGFSTSKDFDHDVFWEWVRMMSESNVVIVSEQSHPEDFVVIWEQTVTRTQDNRKRLTATEKLVCHSSLVPKVMKGVG